MKKTSLLLLVILSSCAFHRGYLSSNAVIVDQNFRILGVTKGTSETTKVLGFGGLQKDALVYDAKNDLYSRIDLKPGQALTNITVDFKNSFFLVVSKQKATVTAEVIDFNASQTDVPNNYGRYGFLSGDSIYVEKNYRDFRKAIVKSSTPTHISVFIPGANNRVTLAPNQCFSLKGSFTYEGLSYQVGETIDIAYRIVTGGYVSNFQIKGILVGINNESFLAMPEKADALVKYPLPRE